MESDELTIRDFPIGLWLAGLVFVGVGGFMFIQAGSSANRIFVFLPILLGLLLLVLPSTLIITADRFNRTLTLRYGLIIPRSVNVISLDEIQTIQVNSTTSTSHSHHSRRRSTTYRLELVKKDGTVVPFRSYYSGGFFTKEQNAKKLRAYMGLAEVLDETPLSMLSNVSKMIQPALERQQAALTGDNSLPRETNGVNWLLQILPLGGTPITRWYSQDFKTPNTFLYLAQKVQGQQTSYGSGFLASLGKTLFKQVISMYGFSGADLPDIELADVYGPLDPSLEAHFMAYTDEPDSARRILNSQAQILLAQWAQRYPLKQVQSGVRFGQISVMFCPSGTYLATLGSLQPDQVEELAVLGAGLVKAQGNPWG